MIRGKGRDCKEFVICDGGVIKVVWKGAGGKEELQYKCMYGLGAAALSDV